jgi:hypothetical protein
VLEEGEVQAGDEIIKLASGPERMPVAEVDAPLRADAESVKQHCQRRRNGGPLLRSALLPVRCDTGRSHS